MRNTVFIDGQAGTTGLKIREDLAKRTDIELLQIDDDKRKDTDERRKLLNEADIVFFCLPDAAARESASFVTNPRTRIIDASTAFRTDNDWVYGLPEIHHQRDRIRSASRVSVPGCHATGLILSLRPLIDAGIVGRDYPVTCSTVTGYSGAGKSGIAEYENLTLAAAKQLNVPRHYSLQRNHKHIPEMQLLTGLTYEPSFTPIKASYKQGIAMSVPLFSRLLPSKSTARDIHDVLSEYYASERFVQVMPFDSDAHLDDGHFLITACNNTNRLELFVFGHDDKINIMARYDNLGKGASGAAIQNLNLMLGCDEGYCLKER
ncbi:N-acetyl-gamma-glutamyl-phosphate reductase [Paenibacillus cellulosilyticus]|uniref:N-acetyl-gamma-glutamyl-phosphate reductase n=1 Tax=Paenibacillus cellulosilyticus TaxID=375489 RepID=A0A2V2YTM9_9BACL|nr:N-acetyl-gamma-glutamyl-phosphate reductase [Paenibacillus cellulosilyticus]PWW02919.1 N-acetyl-gamma-glutamyl-phosphate reductase [Paenibacillus cellulosilyticus]QKS45827.1 N-acetyl-gamma-glutamyl-phosphate reductase [Paenibacillus cellulosilyticus]